MIHNLSLELKKTRRRGIWLIPAALLLIITAWAGRNMNDERFLEYGWLMALFNVPLLNAILIPTAIAVFASRIIDLEHRGNTWKMLETLQSQFDIYITKVLYGFFAVLIFSGNGIYDRFRRKPGSVGIRTVFRADLCDLLQSLPAADGHLPDLFQPGSRPVHRAVRQHGRTFPDVCAAVACTQMPCPMGALWRNNVCRHGR